MVLYRHPDQTSDEFDSFLDRLQLTIDRIKSCTPHCIVITGDFNCRSKQWWPGDVELPEGLASDEFIESNNLTPLIDEPTNIRSTGMSCIDLIITDQPNLFVDFGIHPSLDNHCQYQIIHGKINLLLLINNFQCSSPMCFCQTGIENDEHFLLHCPRHSGHRKDLCNFLLYGNSCFSVDTNHHIIESTISFIKSTSRFKYPVLQHKPTTFVCMNLVGLFCDAG